MAACGRLQLILFQKPVPDNQAFLESLSPWKRTDSSSIDDSFTELFGELHFKETFPPPSTSSGRRKQYTHSDSFSSMNSANLSLCTEGLAFESSHDVYSSSTSNDDGVDGGGFPEGIRNGARSCFERRGREIRADLPPPISSIGRSGTPSVFFKSYREGGRIILKEIMIPTQEFMHARREDGRLRLNFIQSDDENFDDEDDDDEDV